MIVARSPKVIRRGYRKKMNLLKISRFPDFIQCLPDFSQRFLDFSLKSFFKVRKCERCGSLNPRLTLVAEFIAFTNYWIL